MIMSVRLLIFLIPGLLPGTLLSQVIDSTALAAWMADFPYQDTLIATIDEEVYHSIYSDGCDACPPKSVAEFSKAETWDLHNDIETQRYHGYSHQTLSNGLIHVSAFGTFDHEYYLLVFLPDATLLNVLLLKGAFGDAGQSEQYGVYDYTGRKIMLWKADINEYRQGSRWGEQHDSTITTIKFQPDGQLDTLGYETITVKRLYR